MAKTILVIIAVFIAGICYARQTELNPAKNVRKGDPKEDSARLRLLIDSSYNYRFTDPEKGIAVADKAILLAKRLQDHSALASSYNYKALNYSALSDDSAALECFRLGIALRKSMKDSMGLAKIYHNVGISYFNLSDYSSALNFQENSLNLFDRLLYKPGIAAANNSIGVVYLQLANYPKALQYYFNALKIYDQLKDSVKLARVYTNAGIVYFHQGNYSKALEYHFKSLHIFEASHDLYNMQGTLTNLGNTFDEMGDPVKALEYYHRGLDIGKRVNNGRNIAINLINIGIVYFGTKQYDSSLHYIQLAERRYRQTGDKYGLTNALSYLSGIYQHAPPAVLKAAGVAVSARYPEALRLQKQGLVLALQTGSLDNQSEAWGNLSDIYASQKNYARALDAYRHHISLRDSVMNGEKKAEITRIGMQYEFDKKEAIANAEQKAQEKIAAAELNKVHAIKNIIAGTALALLLAAGFIFFFYIRKRNAEEQKKEAEFRVRVTDTEMKALRAQMNPHFIFNSLNSISDYISRNDKEAADYYLTRFAKMMRFILENADQKLISLADDLKILEWYMQLEALRLNQKFVYEISVDKDLDPENTLVPPLILQPFVENSIWHGMSKKTGAGKIRIEIKKEGTLIHCSVEDDGVGRKHVAANIYPAVDSAKKSMGMKITRERINIINEMKKTEMCSVALTDLAEGLRVDVRLPFEPAF